MELNILSKIGVLLMILHLMWILFYYYYGAAKVYNLVEKRRYQYMGCLWIRKKKGEYYLIIPKEIMEASHTTSYRILPETLFVKQKSRRKLMVRFEEQYDVFTTISGEITVKNHIATSNQL